jgi:hypothetical protein
VASLKFEPWWVLWIWVCPWLVLTPKVFQLCINQLVVWFVQVCVSDWSLIIFPNPILELQHASLPLKCCKLGSVPQLLLLSLFSLQTYIWIYQGVWECVNGCPWISICVGSHLYTCICYPIFLLKEYLHLVFLLFILVNFFHFNQTPSWPCLFKRFSWLLNLLCNWK